MTTDNCYTRRIYILKPDCQRSFVWSGVWLRTEGRAGGHVVLNSGTAT